LYLIDVSGRSSMDWQSWTHPGLEMMSLLAFASLSRASFNAALFGPFI
jgi:hypothetical protein